ncbi:HD domain-containing phosphohydrolase [Desulfonatronovibrio hydrogenovorans]|uniref:HD domain-containing phosphohydrolase n=1 Tax=Desulfonatronovibrio hydrogenovorans TaxID=53245 RepID=UPI000690778B|nr:HD domain-containing phosphohydrolase [Desulfonatronovibrio hydrogenovorans]
MVNQRVLFVDDDLNILEGFQRTLRKKFQVETATGPMQGLRTINEKGPYAVVVADLKMPKISGIEFLSRVKKLFPETVRIMLTGHGDLNVAMEAINQGNVFRFLVKPCAPHEIDNALQAGIEQYRLVTLEKDIMEKTVTGITDTLTDILTITNEEAMGRATRIKRFVRDVALHLGETDVWFYETGALLSQIGCVVLPQAILQKIKTGEKLEDEELELFSQHPFIASNLISKIPRLEKLGNMVAYQEKHYNGDGFPAGTVKGRDIPLGSRILKIVLDYDLLINRGFSRKDSLLRMLDRKGRYDPKVIKAFIEVLQLEEQYSYSRVSVKDLLPYMIAGDEILSLSGMLLLQKGSELTLSQVERLNSLEKTYGVKQPISVLIPPKEIRRKKESLTREG